MFVGLVAMLLMVPAAYQDGLAVIFFKLSQHLKATVNSHSQICPKVNQVFVNVDAGIANIFLNKKQCCGSGSGTFSCYKVNIWAFV